MSNTFGKNLKVTIFGQSHSSAIGVTVDGLPAGFAIDFEKVSAFLQRRKPGQGVHTTARKEPDIPEFISGLNDGVTCGSPLTAIIRNKDVHSSDYDLIQDVPRPSHADFTAHVKYGKNHDVRGGGAFSGRLTAPLCIAGGICLQLLEQEKIFVAAHIKQIGNECDQSFDPVNVGENDFETLKKAEFPVLDKDTGTRMLEVISAAKQAGDSLGGIIECAVTGVPAGIGEPMFDGIENKLAGIIFGIPAVKGIEFGSGFASAESKGSENNDAFILKNGMVQTRTNNHGGILGGITSGMPVIFRVVFKPTPSIAMEQDSVSLSRKEEVKLKISGRHDPCIVPRAIPCVEAAAAIAIYDALLDR